MRCNLLRCHGDGEARFPGYDNLVAAHNLAPSLDCAIWEISWVPAAQHAVLRVGRSAKVPDDNSVHTVSQIASIHVSIADEQAM